MRAAAAAVALIVRLHPAAADGERKAAAVQLFDEALALMDHGAYAEACPRLAASQRMDPAVGTQLQLADCLERAGKLASAWANYRDVTTLAERAGQDTRARYARQRTDALLPRLPRLIIQVDSDDPRRLAELVVTRDGVPIDAVLFGSPQLVDPGAHEVRASAPGMRPFAATVAVAELETIVVDVRLEDEPEGPPARAAASPAPVRLVLPPPAVAARPWWRSRRAATITGVAGAATTGLGLVFGLVARDAWHEGGCFRTYCPPEGEPLAERARRFATLSTVTTAAGAVAIAAATALYLTSDPPRRRAVAIALDRGIGVVLTGEF